MGAFDEKEMREIVRQLMAMESQITIKVDSEQEVQPLIHRLQYENMIVFHMGTVRYRFLPRKKEAILMPEYRYSKQQYEDLVTRLTAVVEKLCKSICTSQSAYERELRIHDALCAGVTYADDGPESHSIIGPLLHHRGVCEGIAKAAKVLLQECGIPVRVIRGVATDPHGNQEAHAWNVVQIDGKWYHLDITFDNTISDGEQRYDYFNLSTEAISRDHAINEEFRSLALLCDSREDYFVRAGQYFETADKLKAYLHRCVAEQREKLHVRVAPNVPTGAISGLLLQVLREQNCMATYEEQKNALRNVYSWKIAYRTKIWGGLF